MSIKWCPELGRGPIRQVRWLKWRIASGILCDTKVSLKLKGKFYWTAARPAMLNGTVLGCKEPTRK